MLDLATANSVISSNNDALDASFKASTSGGVGRLPALKLKTASSDACKEGAINVNHYALESNGKITDLDKNPSGLVVSFRAKAIDFGDGSENSKVSSTADINSDEFKRIQTIVASNTPNSHCACGPEFLVYLPEENTYAELYLSGWNAKGIGAEYFFKAMKAGSPITFDSAMKEGKHGKNFYPICEQLTTEIDLSGTSNEELEEKINAFQELSKPTLETSNAVSDDDGR